MKIPQQCVRITKDHKIALEEKASKIILVNDQRATVTIIQVDGCAINEGVRCDFLVVSALHKEHFIELKGGNIDHALAQLERSIEILSVDQQKQMKCSFIISTRCPLTTTKIQELKLKFKQKYNSTLVIKNKYYEHQL